jgi:hypothetical protein
MFNKVYPKSCTMIDTSFERSYKTVSHFKISYKTVFHKKKRFVGSGSWSYDSLAGIFYTDDADFPTREGFRGSIYVQ